MGLYVLCYKADAPQRRRGTIFYVCEEDGTELRAWREKAEAERVLDSMSHRVGKTLEIWEFMLPPTEARGIAETDIKAGLSVTVANGRAMLTHSPLVGELDLESRGRRLGSEGGAK